MSVNNEDICLKFVLDIYDYILTLLKKCNDLDTNAVSKTETQKFFIIFS